MIDQGKREGKMSISGEMHEAWWGGRIFSDETKKADDTKKGIVFYDSFISKLFMSSLSIDVKFEEGGPTYQINRQSALKFFPATDTIIDDAALVEKIKEHYRERKKPAEAPLPVVEKAIDSQIPSTEPEKELSPPFKKSVKTSGEQVSEPSPKEARKKVLREGLKTTSLDPEEAKRIEDEFDRDIEKLDLNQDEREEIEQDIKDLKEEIKSLLKMNPGKAERDELQAIQDELIKSSLAPIDETFILQTDRGEIEAIFREIYSVTEETRIGLLELKGDIADIKMAMKRPQKEVISQIQEIPKTTPEKPIQVDLFKPQEQRIEPLKKEIPQRLNKEKQNATMAKILEEERRREKQALESLARTSDKASLHRREFPQKEIEQPQKPVETSVKKAAEEPIKIVEESSVSATKQEQLKPIDKLESQLKEEIIEIDRLLESISDKSSSVGYAQAMHLEAYRGRVNKTLERLNKGEIKPEEYAFSIDANFSYKISKRLTQIEQIVTRFESKSEHYDKIKQIIDEERQKTTNVPDKVIVEKFIQKYGPVKDIEHIVRECTARRAREWLREEIGHIENYMKKSALPDSDSQIEDVRQQLERLKEKYKMYLGTIGQEITFNEREAWFLGFQGEIPTNNIGHVYDDASRLLALARGLIKTIPDK